VAELLIIHPDGRTRVQQLGEAPVVLGREPSCDVPLEDLSASRRHALIRFDNGAYILEDLGSKNGTLVNNAPATGVALHDGDEILIGAVRAVFREQPAPGMLTSVVVSDTMPSDQATKYASRDEALQLSQRRLEILYDINDRLTRLRDRDELLADAMEVCFEMLRFERGAIAVKPIRRGPVDWPVVHNLRGAEGELTVSRTILSSALERGERVIVNDAESAGIDPTVSMVQHGIRSAMCVPLQSGDQILGVIYGDRVSTGTTYSKEDIDFLAGIARLVTIGLINAQLLDEQRLKVQLENEIGLAREIQTGLFPATLPDRPDLSVAALNDPGNRVSGDCYDTIELSEGRVAFLVADVTGEGVAASLLMANLQAAVRVTIPTTDDLGRLVAHWNALINSNTDASKFITLLIGILDAENRKVRLVSAGHHLPLVVRPGKPSRPLEMEPDYPLGVMEDVDYESREFTLEPGPCTLFCYTDGVIEAMNPDSEQFGMSRLLEVLDNRTDIRPHALVTGVRKAVSRFCGLMPQSDDITIMALHLKETAAEADLPST
jgi:serine phosphatase RsbU (regulator of sigma subunit)